MANKLSIVLFSHELDKACAAFTIANAAAASGMEVTIFFSCWGVNVVRKRDASLSGDGFLSKALNFLTRGGVGKLPLSKFNFLGLGSRLMRRRMRAKNIQSIPEMIADARELGVRFIVCDNPMEIMGLKREELIEEVDDIVGAASYIDHSSDAAITLFI